MIKNKIPDKVFELIDQGNYAIIGAKKNGTIEMVVMNISEVMILGFAEYMRLTTEIRITENAKMKKIE